MNILPSSGTLLFLWSKYNRQPETQEMETKCTWLMKLTRETQQNKLQTVLAEITEYTRKKWNAGNLWCSDWLLFWHAVLLWNRHTHTHTHAHTHARMHAHMHAHTHTHTHACTHTHTCIHTHTHTQTCKHAHTCKHMHTHTHTSLVTCTEREKETDRQTDKQEDRETDRDREAATERGTERERERERTYQDIEVSEKFEFLKTNGSFPICTWGFL